MVALSDTCTRQNDAVASDGSFRLTRLPRRVDIVLMPPPLRLLPGAFTVEKYYKLGELGVFHEDDRVELVNGQIVPMSPIGDARSSSVKRVAAAVGEGAQVVAALHAYLATGNRETAIRARQ